MRHMKPALRPLCVALLITALLAPVVTSQTTALPGAGHAAAAADSSANRGAAAADRRADPCEHEPPGHALGRERRCPPQGSSSGIARGDFNGDGIGDLAIGVPFEDVNGIQDAGGVNVIYGSPSGLSATAGPGDQFLGYAKTNGRAGSALAAGDFDGDGFSDLAIGAPFDDVPVTTSGDGSVRPISETILPFLESSILDGSSNTVDVSAFMAFSPQQVVQDAGRVHVFFGSPAGLDPNTWVSLNLFGAGGTPRSLDEFGASLAWGDFDGDGIGDLAVGVPGHNFQAGAVGVFFGTRGRFGTNRLIQRTNQLWTQDSEGIADVREAGDRFGAALAGGDFNGDNFSDLAVGVPGEDLNVTTFVGRVQQVTTVRDAGAVHVLHGNNSALAPGLTANNSQFWTQNSRQIEGGGEIADSAEDDDRFGSALASFGLGSSDLAVGVPGEDVGSVIDAGAVNVIYFNPAANGLSFLNNQLWTQDSPEVEDVAEAGDQFGFALAGGDFNGDGLKDLAVGAPGETLNDETTPLSNAGAVHVIYYQSFGVGLSATAGPGDQLWTQDSPDILDTAAAGERFGSALTAWDFGRGFLADLAVGVPFQSVVIRLLTRSGFANITIAGAGAVNVIYGDNTTFIPALRATGNQFWTQDSPNIEGVAEAGDQFGRALY